MAHVLSPTIQVMMSAVRLVAKGLIRDFNEVEQLQVSRKGPKDFVTNADVRAERLLHKLLSEARPNYGFLMEEGGEIISRDAKFRWIVDPLDGTNNFLHGFPIFAISAALEETLPSGQKQIVAGIIHAPIQQETYFAEKGKGAFYEDGYNRDKRLRVAGRKDLKDALINIGNMTEATRGNHDTLKGLLPHVAGIRCIGSTCMAMAYVAAGRMDAMVQMVGSKPWDLAAGKLLIEEAGGMVTDVHGGDDCIRSESVIAANPEIHEQLIKLL